MNFRSLLFIELLIAWENILHFLEDWIVVVLISFAKAHQVWLFDGFQWALTDVEKFDESFSGNFRDFLLVVVQDRIPSPNVVAVKWLFNVYFIFIWASCVQAEVNDGELFAQGMFVLDAFECLVIFFNCLVELLGIG